MLLTPSKCAPTKCLRTNRVLDDCPRDYGIEQHITLTLPAWRCLFTVRNYMTLFNIFEWLGSALKEWVSFWGFMGNDSKRGTNKSREQSFQQWTFLKLSENCYKFKIPAVTALKSIGRIAKQFRFIELMISVRPSVCLSVCQHFG